MRDKDTLLQTRSTKPFHATEHTFKWSVWRPERDFTVMDIEILDFKTFQGYNQCKINKRAKHWTIRADFKSSKLQKQHKAS